MARPPGLSPLDLSKGLEFRALGLELRRIIFSLCGFRSQLLVPVSASSITRLTRDGSEDHDM